MSVYDHIPRWQFATSLYAPGLMVEKWFEIPLPFGWVIMLGFFCACDSLLFSVIVDDACST